MLVLAASFNALFGAVDSSDAGEASLVARLAFLHFVANPLSPEHGRWSRFWPRWRAVCGGLTLSRFVEAVRGNEKRPVLLVVDEIGMSQGTPAVYAAVKVALNLPYVGTLITAFDAAGVEAGLGVSATGRPMEWLSLPVLSNAVLVGLAEEQPVTRHLLQLSGGHPRTAEFVLDAAAGASLATTFERVALRLARYVSSRLGELAVDALALLPATLLQRAVRLPVEVRERVASSPLLAFAPGPLEAERPPDLSLYLLWALAARFTRLHRAEDLPFLLLHQVLQHSLNVGNPRAFEHFHAHWEALAAWAAVQLASQAERDGGAPLLALFGGGEEKEEEPEVLGDGVRVRLSCGPVRVVSDVLSVARTAAYGTMLVPTEPNQAGLDMVRVLETVDRHRHYCITDTRFSARAPTTVDGEAAATSTLSTLKCALKQHKIEERDVTFVCAALRAATKVLRQQLEVAEFAGCLVVLDRERLLRLYGPTFGRCAMLHLQFLEAANGRDAVSSE